MIAFNNPPNSFAVAECKTSALTGLSGIMIRETTETFGMVTPDDKFHGNSAFYVL